MSEPYLARSQALQRSILSNQTDPSTDLRISRSFAKLSPCCFPLAWPQIAPSRPIIHSLLKATLIISPPQPQRDYNQYAEYSAPLCNPR
jgi:hypothetical protein